MVVVAAALVLASLSAAPPADASAATRAESARRLAAALRLKEERRLDEALRDLEDLARPARARLPAAPDAEAALPDPEASARQAPPTAASLVAELEAIDARLRLGKPEGLEARLLGLGASWVENDEVRRRARALRGLLYLHDGSLLEPNAIVPDRVDIGDRVRERFFARSGARGPDIPLDLPLRHLSLLPAAEGTGPKSRPILLVGFLGIEDLAEDRRQSYAPALDHFDADPRALLALFVYTGQEEPPPPLTAQAPWSRAVIFWVRGTPQALASVPVRSRYEWLPGPTFFLLAPWARIASWHWPHEDWMGFLADVKVAMTGRAETAAAPDERGRAAPGTPAARAAKPDQGGR